MQLANVANLLVVVLNKDIKIVYYLIAAIFLLELLISAYKLYRILTRSIFPTVQVHPA